MKQWQRRELMLDVIVLIALAVFTVVGTWLAQLGQ
jgi:hypothetical protein